jgi:hypothetical protein
MRPRHHATLGLHEHDAALVTAHDLNLSTNEELEFSVPTRRTGDARGCSAEGVVPSTHTWGMDFNITILIIGLSDSFNIYI